VHLFACTLCDVNRVGANEPVYGGHSREPDSKCTIFPSKTTFASIDGPDSARSLGLQAVAKPRPPLRYSFNVRWLRPPGACPSRARKSPVARLTLFTHCCEVEFLLHPWPSGQYGKSSPRYSRRGTVLRWILESLDYKNFGKRGHPLFRGTADSATASSLR